MRASIPCFLLASLAGTCAHATRVKDLASVEGFRDNPLVGTGIVVGLAGTGDDASSFFTRRPLATLLKHLGNVVDPNDVKARNVALVMVTAKLPPFARPGMNVDVVVSSIGTARSLQGGTLIATTLQGADGQVYAIAQGPLAVGGFTVGSSSGSSASRNHVTAGRIPSGAVVEREAPSGLPKTEVVLLLHHPDATSATRMAAAINGALAGAPDGGGARVRDPAAVVVPIGRSWEGKVVELVAKLEAVESVPDAPARVVIDERTGTVVVGAGVSVGPAAIAHAGLSITVNEKKEVSQPAMAAAPAAVALATVGPVTAPATPPTTVAATSEVKVDEEAGKLVAIPEAATVADVAAALNALGCKPRDLLSIFQALRAAGALRAEIEVL